MRERLILQKLVSVKGRRTREGVLPGVALALAVVLSAGVSGRSASAPGKNQNQMRRTATTSVTSPARSANKKTVQRYMEAFNRTNHAAILACLTDDVEWVIPGAFHLRGKKAFDGEIENDAFVGNPVIRISRMTEEDNVVIAEGSVRSARKDGGMLNAVFCDVFVMRNGKIRHLTSYLMEIKE